MRRLFISLLLVVGLAGGAVAWQLARPSHIDVVPLPPGDQEIAYIQAATSISAWERFVTGVHRVSRDWPELAVDDRRAFPEETTATPELVLSLAGTAERIHIRWYKLSKGETAARWVERLAKRMPPPLVVVGGGSSDRALDLARAMATQPTWSAEPPALFFTTATATTIATPDEPSGIDLMGVYRNRSFRMCFTNEQIATSVVEFVWSQPDLRPQGNPVPLIPAVGLTSTWEVAIRMINYDELFPPSVYALKWDDDPYSVDLSNQFHRALHETAPQNVPVRETIGIPYSVGGNYAPNHWEAEAAERLLNGLRDAPLERQLLVLPTSVAPARRVLRAVTGALPLVGRNLVAITGDSINLNNVFRDADIGWNIRAIPVPLVFFAHQNPVDWDWPVSEEDTRWPVRTDARSTLAAGEAAQHQTPDSLAPPTNTDETLLHRDLLRLLTRAAFGVDQQNKSAELTTSAGDLCQRLRNLTPPVFDANGNRLGGQGEFVVVLRPQFSGPMALSQVMSTATLEVWTRQNGNTESNWQPVKRLILEHGRTIRPTS